MLERDRIALREAKAAIAAEEKAEQEERDRPLKDAIAENQNLTRQLHATIRERIQTLPDENEATGTSDFWVEPELEGVELPYDYAMKVNADIVRLFLRSNFWFYGREITETNNAQPQDELETQNLKALFDYFGRQKGKVEIFSVGLIQRAADRLREYGILKERPPAQPTPKPAYVNLEIDHSQDRPAPVVQEGFDLETGEKRSYSEFEVNRMDSETYKRCFRLYKASFELPNTGPGVYRLAQRSGGDE
jgi:hypothetical protein